MTAVQKWLCTGLLVILHILSLALLNGLWDTLNRSLDDKFTCSKKFIAETTFLFNVVTGVSISLVSISILQLVRSRGRSYVIKAYRSLMAVVSFFWMIHYISKMNAHFLGVTRIHQPEIVYILTTILWSATSVWSACVSMRIIMENEQVENIIRNCNLIEFE